jgi:predicted nucleic acid-binding protein
MHPVLFDTSVYIRVLRMGGGAASGIRRMAEGGPIWLSSVVLEELYAGAGSAARERGALSALERDFSKARRILVPNLTDWTETGKLLASLSARYDYEEIGRGRLTNDALIAMSAARMGITVVTANARDFGKLAAIRPFHWRTENGRN